MRFVGLGYFAAIGLIVVLADLGGLAPVITYVHSIPWGDKVIHFALATGLGFFANAVGVPRANYVLFPAVLLEELSQRWIPGRTFDLLDLAADFGGLALGSALAFRWGRRQRLAAA